MTPQTDGLSTISLILKYDAGKDRKLREAASYRYIIKISLDKEKAARYRSERGDDHQIRIIEWRRISYLWSGFWQISIRRLFGDKGIAFMH